MTDDLYAILGVAPTASSAEIKQAYRALARRYHPDRNPGDTEAADRFKDAAEAYRVLGDEELRAEYDEDRRAVAGAPDPRSPSQVLHELFGTSKRKRRRTRDPATERGADLRYRLEIDFEEAIRGTERTIQVPSPVRCRQCAGTGAAPGSTPVVCRRCGGQGTIREQRGFFDAARRCPDCGGAGKQSAVPCDACDGTGTQEEDRPVVVQIPPGVNNGTRLKVSGGGRDGEHGGAAGDLFVVLTVLPHPFLDRDEDDLLVEVPVTLAEAALGTHVEIPTLDGPVRMRVPPGSQHGRVFRLKGRGLPRRDGSGAGDQRVRIAVEIPTSLGDEMRALLEEVRALEAQALDPESRVAAFRRAMARDRR